MVGILRCNLKTPCSYGVAFGPASNMSRDVRSDSDGAEGSKR